MAFFLILRLEGSRRPKLLNLNRTTRLLFCDVDDNLMGDSTHTLKITDALLFAQRKIGLEVNAEQTKYIFMFREQNARKNHEIKFGNRQFNYISNSNIRKQAYVQKLHTCRN